MKKFLNILIDIFKYFCFFVKIGFTYILLFIPIWALLMILILVSNGTELIPSVIIFLILLFIVYFIHSMFEEINKYLSFFLSILMFFINLFFTSLVYDNSTTSNIVVHFAPHFSFYLSVITYYMLRYNLKRVVTYFKNIKELNM